MCITIRSLGRKYGLLSRRCTRGVDIFENESQRTICDFRSLAAYANFLSVLPLHREACEKVERVFDLRAKEVQNYTEILLEKSSRK